MLISKKILSTIVLSTALIFSASANAAKKPKLCKEFSDSNCVLKSEYYENMYEKIIAKVKQDIAKNPEDEHAKEFLEYAEALHNAAEKYCNFTLSTYYHGNQLSENDWYQCQSKQYEDLMEKKILPYADNY